MNDSLVSYDGGQPVYADDITFVQNALASMTNTLAKAFGETYIIYGCLDESKSNVIEGAVCISGKIYQVPSLGPLGNKKLCYREILSDERDFENQQKYKVIKSYEAYLSEDTGGAVAYIDLKTAKKVNEWAAGEWNEDAYIELYSGAKERGWVDPEVKRLKVLGGWLYYVVLKHKENTDSGTMSSIGVLKGVSIKNEINVLSTIDFITSNFKAPVLINIPASDAMFSSQSIFLTSCNSTTDDGWFGDPTNYNKRFVIQFSFFDADEKVAYDPRQIEF